MPRLDPDARPAIPEPMKREVRQRCGFGCVVCGIPIYHYDHIEDYADVLDHAADNLTLLCATHHDEKTHGLLPTSDVLRCNADPINVREGASAPYNLHFSGTDCEFVLGDSRFSREFGTGGRDELIAVMINEMPMLSFRADGEHLLLSANLFDEKGRQVLKIDDNQLIYSMDPWDIERIRTRLTLRARKRDIIVELVFHPPNRLHINRAKLLCGGTLVLIHPDRVEVNNVRWSRCTATGCTIGINISTGARPVFVR